MKGQGGMVVYWRKLRGRGWRTSALVNGLGATVIGVVLLVVAVTKAHEGAWIIILLIPVFLLFLQAHAQALTIAQMKGTHS